MILTDKKIEELRIKANDIRKDIVRMLAEAGSGHTAGALGMADVFTLLYFHILRHDPKNPNWEERDKLVLSNGHICPVLYATMAHAGYFPVEELMTLRKFGSRLQGHPDRTFLPYLETSSGPLGSGLSQAIGMALADKIDGSTTLTTGKKDESRKIYCLMSDGEHDEGNTWEAIMLAGKNKLNNLVAIVDRNKIQIDGGTEQVMPLESIVEKWRAFNWQVLEADGHNFKKLNEVFSEIEKTHERPVVIIAHTISGKGVKEWEGDYHWHGIAPSKEQGAMALKELEDFR